MIELEEIRRRDYESIAREEPDEEQRQVTHETARSSDVQSIVTVYVVTLIADMCRGLLFPVLWLRVQSVGGTAFAQGFVVASFSVGRLIGSLLLGLVVDYLGYYTGFLLTGSLALLGSIVFAIGHTLLAIIAAQFIMGLGAGSLSASRSFVAETTSTSHRTANLAYLTSLQYGGFTVSPIFGSIIIYTAKRFGLSKQSFFGITELTMPAVVLGIFSTISLVFVFTTFKEPQRISHTHHVITTNQKRQSNNREKKDDDFTHIQSELELTTASSREEIFQEQRHQYYFELAIAGSILQFLTKGAIGVFETLLVLYAMKRFYYTEIQIGSSVSSNGFIGVVILLFFPILLRYIKDVDLMIFGLSLMIVSNWVLNSYFTSSIKLQEWRFMVALFCMFGVGYPVGHTALLGLFAKIVHTGKQGSMMGIFGAIGSSARIVVPICAGAIAKTYGPDLVFMISGLLLVITLVLVGYARCTITAEINY